MRSVGAKNSNFTFGLLVDISIVNGIVNQLMTGGVPPCVWFLLAGKGWKIWEEVGFDFPKKSLDSGKSDDEIYQISRILIG